MKILWNLGFKGFSYRFNHSVNSDRHWSSFHETLSSVWVLRDFSYWIRMTLVKLYLLYGFWEIFLLIQSFSSILIDINENMLCELLHLHSQRLFLLCIVSSLYLFFSFAIWGEVRGAIRFTKSLSKDISVQESFPSLADLIYWLRQDKIISVTFIWNQILKLIYSSLNQFQVTFMN